MASFSSSSPSLVAITTSNEETLLLTRTGEVLVCHHAADDDQNDANDMIDDDGILALDNSREFLDDCSLNANSFEASITGRNKLHRPQQRHSLQKAWAECCEPERFCDLSTQQKNENNTLKYHSSDGRRGGLFGGSEEHNIDTAKSNYNEVLNGMSIKLNIDQDSHESGSDWNTVPPKRKKKMQQKQRQQNQSPIINQQQQQLLQTPPRNASNERRRKTDNSVSSTINNFGSNDDSDDDDKEEDEIPDRINMNDVQLQDHNNFTFIGGSSGSPTPMLSFDYSGYEPPTPERLHGMNDDDSCTSTEATFSMTGPLPPPLPRTLASTKAGEDTSGNGTKTSQQEQSRDEKQQLGKQHHHHQRRRKYSVDNTSSMLPGIPTFLHHLSQVRITHLSAHPRGHHVLLISEEGLLFSYGSNRCGQLGLGRFHKKGRGGGRGIDTNNEVDSTRFTVTAPSIVTPLLENGGKTVSCAAGVDYSLVVVQTEGSRLARRRYNKVSPSSASSNNSPDDYMAHHQMYGFGNNQDMKLGLLDPDRKGRRRNTNDNINSTTPLRSHSDNGDLDSPGSSSPFCFSTPNSFASVDSGIEEGEEVNCVFLPRRVALHCRVISRKGTNFATKQTQADQSPLEYGIFKVAASAHHSAALVRRPSGAVELYCWGRRDALGQPLSDTPLEDDIPSPRRWECVPLRNPQKKEMRNQSIGTPTLVTTLSLLHESQSNMKSGAPPRTPSPRKQSRQRNTGKAITSENLGGGTKSLLNPTEYLVDVALGPSCTHSVTSSGRWFSFGSSQDGLLGLGANVTVSDVPAEVQLSDSGAIQSVSIGEKHAVAVSKQGHAYTWGRCHHGITTSLNGAEPVSSPQLISFEGKKSHKRRTLETALLRHIGQNASKTTNGDGENTSNNTNGVASAHAGRDLSVFVLESGCVLTCGQKSGRLGQGNVSMDVNSPRKMFGGLQLWHND